MARPINKMLRRKALTFEMKILDAIWNKNNKKLEKMIILAERLYKEGYLTDEEFNTMTDIELLKKIYI